MCLESGFQIWQILGKWLRRHNLPIWHDRQKILALLFLLSSSVPGACFMSEFCPITGKRLAQVRDTEIGATVSYKILRNSSVWQG